MTTPPKDAVVEQADTDSVTPRQIMQSAASPPALLMFAPVSQRASTASMTIGLTSAVGCLR
jgi:hypothetical protein